MLHRQPEFEFYKYTGSTFFMISSFFVVIGSVFDSVAAEHDWDEAV